MIIKFRLWCLIATAFCASAGGALAQRADENVVTAAEDAFGTKVGSDNVGLYDPNNARGFDPQVAGNVRIEGLYFDQQANFGARLARSTTMRIGLAAQSYPFPAPTGIADIHLLLPANETILSFSAEYNTPVEQSSVTAEVSTPLVADKLGMVVSGKAAKRISDWRARSRSLLGGMLFEWTPNDSVEFIPFVYYNQTHGEEVQPYIIPSAAALPPRFDRSVFFGQSWAARNGGEFNGGAVLRTAATDNWRVAAGMFRSVLTRPRNHVVFYRNTQPDGTANLDITKYPAHKSASTSGEVRASGIYEDGSFRHTMHLAVRGRDTRRIFGGGDTVDFGPARVGVYQPVAEPVFNVGIREQDAVRQITPGVTYVGEWIGVGEFSAGLQKAFYDRNFGKLSQTPVATSSKPWLYNSTVALHPTNGLALYAGYTRGLEEFGTAPDNAVNAGQPMRAGVTQQIDAGIRYRIIPGLSLVAGVFEVSKPYFDRNTVNIYSEVGSLRHRGFETSLAGKPVDNVTVVAGAVFLQARVSGLPVDQGLIGQVPPGTPPHLIRANVQYDIPGWEGFSIDGQVEVTGSHYANRRNTLRVPSAAKLALGARYTFTALGAKATLRTQVLNLTNAYDWTVNGASGRLSPTSPRTFSVKLAADF